MGRANQGGGRTRGEGEAPAEPPGRAQPTNPLSTALRLWGPRSRATRRPYTSSTLGRFGRSSFQFFSRSA